jgi:DNA-binding CsgD family transcriptional regulator
VDTGNAEEIPRLTEAASRTYAWAVTQRSISPEKTHRELGLDDNDADKALRLLKRLGLLRTGADDNRQLVAVPPQSARLQVLGPLLRDMQLAQERIDQIQDDLNALVPAYEDGVGQGTGRHDVEQIVDPDVVRRIIVELLAGARTEVLAAEPGGGLSPELAVDSLTHADDVLRRGVRLRAVLQHTAQFNQGTIAYVERVSALGARVRTTAAGLGRLLVVDATTAVLPLTGQRPGIAVVHDPSVMEFVVDCFERSWTGATDFPLQYSKAQAVTAAADVRQAIVKLLVEGENDKRIAERVGLSLRSCQRHIAEIMKDLGARNRLHAGFLLHYRLSLPQRTSPDGWPGLGGHTRPNG